MRLSSDDKWLIEPLSVLTIYMAFYTIVHLLRGGPVNLNGSISGYARISADVMSDSLWVFILLEI